MQRRADGVRVHAGQAHGRLSRRCCSASSHEGAPGRLRHPPDATNRIKLDEPVGCGSRHTLWTFVTGFVSHLELFSEAALVRRFFERLSSFSRLILWDKREQGLSDRLGQPPTLEQGMDDLAAVLDAAGSEHTALFGISEGGPLSILYAASFPHRVSHLAL